MCNERPWCSSEVLELPFVANYSQINAEDWREHATKIMGQYLSTLHFDQVFAAFDKDNDGCVPERQPCRARAMKAHAT
jgi:hypothetical protein